MDCLMLPLGLDGSSIGFSFAKEGGTQGWTRVTPGVCKMDRRLRSVLFFMAFSLFPRIVTCRTAGRQPSTWFRPGEKDPLLIATLITSCRQHHFIAKKMGNNRELLHHACVYLYGRANRPGWRDHPADFAGFS